MHPAVSSSRRRRPLPMSHPSPPGRRQNAFRAEVENGTHMLLCIQRLFPGRIRTRHVLPCDLVGIVRTDQIPGLYRIARRPRICAGFCSLNLVIGVIVDRFHRKGLILSANLLIIAVMISVTIAIGAGVAKPWLIIGTHMLLQVTGSLYRPALQAFLPEAFAKEELPKIFTRAGAASDLGALLGSSLSGTVMAYFSAASSMAAVICCFLLGTVALMPVKHKTALDRGQ